MKIIAYGIRDDEKPYLDEWVKDNSVEVKAVAELLTEDNIDLAKGYDGVVAYQQKPYTDGIFKKMDEFGIHAFSLRNVGVDNVPVESVKKYNIKVSNVPAYSPSAIAELSVTALMALLRRLPRFENKMAKGDFRWAPDIAQELNELTVGVVGTGRIGRAAMDIFKGFGAKVIGYDVFRNPELEKEGIYVDSLDDIYKQADVITLHMPALKDNYHMLNDDAFGKMKDGVYILNYARGTLIDTDALIRALDNGKVAGAGLDTYENEVGIFDVDHKGEKINDDAFNNLYARDNVLITPHAAFYTTKAVKNMVQISLNNNKSFIENGKADNEVSFD